MTRVATNGSVTKPKVVCRIDGCTKEYATKSYLKVHQKTKHNMQLDNNDTIADVVNANEQDEEDEENDAIEEALLGGTQTLLDYIEKEVIDKAQEAETEDVENILEELDDGKYLVTMVSHMVTPNLFEKEVGPRVSEDKEADISDCGGCETLKKAKEKLKDKYVKDTNALIAKVQSVTGQNRFHMNKGKELEKVVEISKKTINDLKERVDLLEAENVRAESLNNIRFTAPDTNVSASTPEVQTEKPEQNGRFKCKKCNEERENIRSLSDHIKIKHPNSQFKCDKCQQRLPFKSALKHHMKTKHPKINYQCFVCKTTFISKIGLISHRSSRCKSPPSINIPQVAAPGDSMMAAPGASQVAASGASTAADPGASQVAASRASTAAAPGASTAAAPGASRLPAPGASQAPESLAPLTAPQRQADTNVNQWLPRLKCQKCEYETNTQNELVYHIEERHSEPIFRCDNCPQHLRSNEELVNHIVQMHTSQGHRIDTNVPRVRNTIDNGIWDCKLCGKNTRSNYERDTHVCQEHPFQTISQQNRRRTKSQTPCTRGHQCHHYRLGKCHFSHAQTVERPVQAQDNTRNMRRNDMWCSYQDKCNRRQTCVYKHMDRETDFIQNILRQAQC